MYEYSYVAREISNSNHKAGREPPQECAATCVAIATVSAAVNSKHKRGRLNKIPTSQLHLHRVHPCDLKVIPYILRMII